MSSVPKKIKWMDKRYPHLEVDVNLSRYSWHAIYTLPGDNTSESKQYTFSPPEEMTFAVLAPLK